MILSFLQNTTAFGKLQQAVRLFEKIFRVDRTVEAGYNKKQKGTATAAGPLIANLTQLTARVAAGRSTRIWGKVQRNRQNDDHADCHAQELRTALASHPHHLPPFKIRWGF